MTYSNSPFQLPTFLFSPLFIMFIYKNPPSSSNTSTLHVSKQQNPYYDTVTSSHTHSFLPLPPFENYIDINEANCHHPLLIWTLKTLIISHIISKFLNVRLSNHQFWSDFVAAKCMIQWGLRFNQRAPTRYSTSFTFDLNLKGFGVHYEKTSLRYYRSPNNNILVVQDRYPLSKIQSVDGCRTKRETLTMLAVDHKINGYVILDFWARASDENFSPS